MHLSLQGTRVRSEILGEMDQSYRRTYLQVNHLFFQDPGKLQTQKMLKIHGPQRLSGYIVTGDSWFATLNILCKLKERGHYFMGIVKTGHSCIPLNYLREHFSELSRYHHATFWSQWRYMIEFMLKRRMSRGGDKETAKKKLLKCGL